MSPLLVCAPFSPNAQVMLSGYWFGNLQKAVDGLETQLRLGRTQEGGSVGAHFDGPVWGPRPAALPCLKSAFIQSGASAAECSGLSRTILILRDEACLGLYQLLVTSTSSQALCRD